MCLITRQIKPITTKKDIVCYKLVTITGNIIRSYFHFSFIWTFKKLESTALLIEKILPKDTEVFDNTQQRYYKDINKQPNKKLTSVSNGFHAGLTIDVIGNRADKICEFLIPKGSLIFKDATGLIVSNQIMLIK